MRRCRLQDEITDSKRVLRQGRLGVLNIDFARLGKADGKADYLMIVAARL